MANIFLNIPVLGVDGPGPSVAVNTAGKEKTFAVQGPYSGTITLEISNDGVNFVPLTTFSGGADQKRSVPFAAAEIRAFREGVLAVNPGTPVIDLGANDNGTQFVGLPTTPGNGTGPGIDVSALGTFNTVAVGGSFSGVVNIEISDDGVNWVPALPTFLSPSIYSRSFIAQFMRAVRSGVQPAAPGAPFVSVAATNDPASGGGSATDELVKITALDTTASFLQSKLAGGAGIATRVLNSGGDEDLEVSNTLTAQNASGGGVFSAAIGDLWLVDPTAGATTIELPAPSADFAGQQIVIKNITALGTPITIDAAANGGTLDSSPTFVISSGFVSITVVGTGIPGTDWSII